MARKPDGGTGMKVGDLVKKNFIRGDVIGIITAIRHDKEHQCKCTGACLVAVMWPGCKPFWTSSLHLEVVNEGR